MVVERQKIQGKNAAKVTPAPTPLAVRETGEDSESADARGRGEADPEARKGGQSPVAEKPVSPLKCTVA